LVVPFGGEVKELSYESCDESGYIDPEVAKRQAARRRKELKYERCDDEGRKIDEAGNWSASKGDEGGIRAAEHGGGTNDTPASGSAICDSMVNVGGTGSGTGEAGEGGDREGIAEVVAWAAGRREAKKRKGVEVELEV
jgi:hypothetical protein